MGLNATVPALVIEANTRSLTLSKDPLVLLLYSMLLFSLYTY
jgi:hypothetical protein